MRRSLAILAVILGLQAAFPANAGAEEQLCAQRADLVGQLERKFGEVRHGAGLRGAEAVFEIWASSGSGSWTIIMTRPDGVACIMAAGENWTQDALARQAGDPA